MKAEPQKPTNSPSSTKKSKVRENVEALLIAIVLALFIRTFIVQAFKIPSGSMKDTLLIGDYILVNKFIYGIRMPFSNSTIIPVENPKRGDIIVFKFPKDPSKDFIKRVIGVGGDTVEIHNKAVYVNGELLNDKAYAIHEDPDTFPAIGQNRDNFGPVKVPKGKLFVMGDNRDESNDSRFWGFVDLSELRGKAFIIYWSWDKQDVSVRWGRLGHLIH